MTFGALPQTPAYADDIRDMQWHVEYLKYADAHKITQGSGVTVAVVDSGIFRHQDLISNLKRGTDTVAGGDGTGQVDQDGHGTQMAGVIAGHGHNTDAGVLGVAPASTLLPVKSIGPRDNGVGLESGIKWAAEAGADVINVSTGGPRSRGIEEAISAATKADAVVIAASGNRSQTLRLDYPAAMPEVLAVGATDRNGKLADFSLTGKAVGICAPGVDIVTTNLDNSYGKGSGTSEATAIVSGAAALVRAKYPDLSAPEVIHRLTATADDNGPPGRDEQCGYGVLNIVKALTADVPPLNSAGVSAGPSAAPPVTPSVGGASTDVASPEPAGANLPLIAGIGAAVLAVGAVLAFLLRRRRASS
ncbi:S8 family serine peptidase [Actinoplanes philippinensis]|uniref:S8 family serine peptidase n=1 Tax=Actinoplanes philippinensis TaxID=35752 RepID=UPI0033FB5B9C